METIILQTNELPQELNVKIVKNSELQYKIIRCNSEDETNETLGKYNSVILAEPEGNILCYTPPTSMPQETFVKKYPSLTNDIVVNEAVEGTLISLFWDERNGHWEIATKGAVGGNYWFYRTKYPGFHENTEQHTFRKMFLDALHTDMDITEMIQLPKGGENNRYCYNFVLQHPDNHIVFEIEMPKIYLVSVYSITTANEISSISPETYKEWVKTSNMAELIYFPQLYSVDNYTELKDYYGHAPYPMGIMITHKNGERTCIENEIYLDLKELRGNHPNLQFQYMVLKQQQREYEFLSHFPKYTDLFNYFYLQNENFITQLHSAYVSYYVKKTGNLISKRYFSLIHKLHHTVYLPSLSSTKIIMKRSEIKKHFEKMSPKQTIYFLNYIEHK